MPNDIHDNLRLLDGAAQNAIAILESVGAIEAAKRLKAALSAVQTSTSETHEACKVALRAFQDNLGFKGKRAQAPWLDAWRAVQNAVGRA